MIDENTLRLLACQIDIPPMMTTQERDTHLERCAALISEALHRKHADLVVLPELSSIEYARESFGHLDVLAEALDGPSFQTWRTVALKHNTHITYGFAHKSHNGFHISTVVVGPDGSLVGHYDKIHLCQYGASMEKEYFTSGQHLFTFTVNGLKCAPIICYDIRIPELSRTLTIDQNVDLILHCGAYYRDESFATWHDFTTTRALENQIYLLSLNRAGKHYGGSAFCYPWMDDNRPRSNFSDFDEDLQYFDLSSATIKEAREGYSFLKDRLDDYRDLPLK